MTVQRLGRDGPPPRDVVRRALQRLVRWVATWWPFGVSRLYPDVHPHLLLDEGEDLADEVHHHPIVYVLPRLEMLAGLLLCVSPLFVGPRVGWLLLAVAAALLAHGWWGVLARARDVFVITNMRVFRISGVFNTRKSILPLTRILDITVVKPLLGRLLGYGHFVFESAAHEQNMHDIRHVPKPDLRDQTIQRVIQKAGLRKVWSGSVDG